MGWFKKQIELIKQGFRDISDFKKFKKDLDYEEADINSKYNEYNLIRNDKGDVVSLFIDIPEDYEKSGTDRQKMLYLKDVIKPINAYFESVLNWGEYLIISYYHAVSDDPNEIVYTYVVQWKFTPIALTRPKFWVLSIMSVLIVAAAIAFPIIFL